MAKCYICEKEASIVILIQATFNGEKRLVYELAYCDEHYYDSFGEYIIVNIHALSNIKHI